MTANGFSPVPPVDALAAALELVYDLAGPEVRIIGYRLQDVTFATTTLQFQVSVPTYGVSTDALVGAQTDVITVEFDNTTREARELQPQADVAF